MKRVGLVLLCVFAAGLMQSASPASAEVWSAVSGFSATNGNPNGVWSYGYKPKEGGLTFTPYPDAYPNVWEMGYMQWQDTAHTSVFDHRGWIMCNPTAAAYTTGWGVYFAAHGINMHPGNLGTHTTIRWTSPVEHWVKITGSWRIYNYWGAPGGFLQYNGQPLFDVQMLGCGIPGQEQPDPGGVYPYTGSYIGKVLAHPTDVIDLSVNWGPDVYWGGDATGIVFTVETTTAPSFISGVVKSNLPGNTGIAGVTVETTTGGFTTKTDETGHYSLLVDPGTYTVLYSRSDCVTQQRTGVEVGEEATVIVDVTLTTTKTSWNAATDYSSGSNPGFDWAYGYRPVGFTGPFTLYDVTDNIGAFELYQWSSSEGATRGWISYNANPAPLEVPSGVWWAPHTINMHPGQNGDRPTVRWTSPMAGWVDVTASFAGMDPGGSTSDGHVLVNDLRVWDCVINGFAGKPGTGASRFGPSPDASKSFTFWVNERDTIDLTGGFGINSDWGGDATGASLAIAPSASPHASISGVVRSNSAGNPPVAGVKVRTLSGGYSTTTNVSGQYWLAPSPGTYMLEFSKAGFETQQSAAIAAAQNEFKTADVILIGLWASTNLHPDARSSVLGMSGLDMAGRVAVGGVDHAALWKSGAAGWNDLHPATGFASSVAYSVSGAQAAGGGQSTTDSASHALVWNTTTGSVADVHPAGYTSSAALACQGGSQAGYAVDPGGIVHAARWVASAGSFVDLNPFLAEHSYAGAAYGSMQGGFANVLDYGTGANAVHAGLWSGTPDSWQDLHPADATISQINCMDASSQGGYTGVFAEVHAALWSGSAGSWINLNPSGLPGSQVYALYGNLQAGSLTTVSGATHAALWSGTGDSCIDLNDFLPAGYGYSVARGVYKSGNKTWIAGYARTDPADQNTERAFLWGVPEPVEVSRISELQQGAYITIAGKSAVCGGTTFSDGFFIEEPDRSSGMRVANGAGSAAVQPGDLVTVTGTVRTDAAGQLYIDASSVTRASGQPVRWMAMNNRALTRVRTVLVKVCGRITAVDPGKTYVYLDDGCGVNDGGGTIGIRMDCSRLSISLSGTIGALAPGKYLTVTGIAAKEPGRSTVRPRSASDIVIDQ